MPSPLPLPLAPDVPETRYIPAACTDPVATIDPDATRGPGRTATPRSGGSASLGSETRTAPYLKVNAGFSRAHRAEEAAVPKRDPSTTPVEAPKSTTVVSESLRFTLKDTTATVVANAAFAEARREPSIPARPTTRLPQHPAWLVGCA
jgi:hypothetical protein